MSKKKPSGMVEGFFFWSDLCEIRQWRDRRTGHRTIPMVCGNKKEKEPAGAPVKMECYKISAGTRQKEEYGKNPSV